MKRESAQQRPIRVRSTRSREIQNIIVNKNCDFPGGKQVAEQIVTLPTHPYVDGERPLEDRDRNSQVYQRRWYDCGFVTYEIRTFNR